MVEVSKTNREDEVFGPLRRESDEVAATTLGEDTEFSGTLKFGKTLKVLGKFEGDMSSDGSLIVGRTADIKAEIRVGNVIIEGKVTGNITAVDLVDLRSTAELYGDIKSSKLKIEEGVVFVGRSEVRPKGSAMPEAAPKNEERSPTELHPKKDDKDRQKAVS